MRRSARRGFSLMELMLGMALMGLIVAMGLLQTRRATETAETRGLAELIAEELKAARRQAIAGRAPVAVAFPSNNGASAHSQGFYLLRGIDRPAVIGGRRFDGDFPNACAFLGYWPVVSSPGNSRSAPILNGNKGDFNPTTWAASFPRDYMVIFLPSGQVMTNGLTHYGREYHILVTQGVRYGAASAPPGANSSPLKYFTPSEISAPYTVAISSAGSVRVVPGLPDAPSVGIVSGNITTPSAPSLPAVASSNNKPVLISVSADPAPAQLPAGVSAVIPSEGYLSLRLAVREPDGQIPQVTWTTSSGSFSSEHPTLMEWDAKQNIWTSVWNWTPPPSAKPDDTFTLRYKVDDQHGGVISGNLGATGKVQIGQAGKLAFTTTRDDGTWEIAQLNPDGTNMVLVTKEGDRHENYYASWSPNGTQLACYGWDIYDDNNAENLYIVNADGSGLTPIHTLSSSDDSYFDCMAFWGSDQGPAWSVDGTRLAYSIDDSNGSGSLWTINGDGSGRRKLTNPSPDVYDYAPVWDPTGNWIVFHRDRYTAAQNCDLMRVSPTGTLDPLTSAANDVNNFDPSFSPDGQRIVFAQCNLGTSEGRLLTMKPDGSNVTPVPNTSSYLPGTPRFSPDGTMIAFLDDELYVITVGGLHPDTHSTSAKKISSCEPMDFSWSPDSSQIIYSDGYTKYKANVLGALDERRISPAQNTEDWVPAWSH